MGVMENVLAWVVAAACGLMLVRLFIGEQRRMALDRTLVRWSRGVQRHAYAVYRWRANRQARLDAAAAAHAAIERARHSKVSKAGNVYTPEVFKGPKKPH
jgi:hypothetical protein